jgi:hypothetical protein
MEEENDPNWEKMVSHSERAQYSDARDKNRIQMAVPALGGRVN